jgi:hypothetical protein
VAEAGLPRHRRLTLRGCLTIGIAGSALAIIAAIAGIEAFGSDTGGDGGARYVSGGEASAYPQADVQHLEKDHIFVVRFEDRSFVAFYDKTPTQQEPSTDCRLRFDDNASLNTLPQISGFRGAFVDECEGARAVYRVDGAFAFGAGFGELDRFETVVSDDGELLIDVSERTCTRSIGVPGLPPFEPTRCRGNP